MKKSSLLLTLALFVCCFSTLAQVTISTAPASFTINHNTCNASASDTLWIYSTGTDTLDWNLLVSPNISYDSTSTKNYSGTGASTDHLFAGLGLTSDSVFLTITINGDFDEADESADLYVDGGLIGTIADGNQPIGTDVIVTYAFGGAQVQGWLQDGEITVTLQNSVEVGGIGDKLHQVQMELNGASFTTTASSSGSTPDGDTSFVIVSWDATDLPSGTYLSDLVINSNDTTTPQVIINSTMNVATAAALALGDTCLDLDSIMESTVHTDTLWFFNTACDTLFITNITNVLAEYTLSTTTASILWGDSAMIIVTFSPTSIGTFDDTLTISNNVQDTSVCLTGDAYEKPLISNSPASLSVTLTICDDNDSSLLTIYNSEPGDLIYTTSNAEPWLTVAAGPDTIANGDSTVLDVVIDATGLLDGSYADTIELNSNDPLTPVLSFPVSLTVAGGPAIALSDSCFSADTTVVNNNSQSTFKIFNTGCDTLFISPVTNTLSVYTHDAGGGGFVLAGDSATIIVDFDPVAAGTFVDSFIITNNDIDTFVCITGVGLSAPLISVNPDSVETTIVACDDSSDVTLTVYNTGGSDLTFTSDATVVAKTTKHPYAYIADHNETVTVVDLATNTVDATIGGMSSNPWRVQVRPNGENWYVSHRNSGNWRVYDASSNAFITSIDVGGGRSTGAGFTPDNKYAYVGAFFSDVVRKIDLETNTIVGSISANMNDPQDIVVNDAGTFAYVANRNAAVAVIDLSNDNVVASVGNNSYHSIAITPDGAFVYVTRPFSNTVDVINTSTNTLTTSIAVQTRPQELDITPDGAFVYVANKASNSVSVIATATNVVVATITDGANLQDPWGVAVAPDGEYVYVSSRDGSQDMIVIEVASNTVVDYIDIQNTPRGVATLQKVYSPFVSLIPESDTIAAGDSSTVTVRFKSAGLNSGTYYSDINLFSDDQLNPTTTVVAKLTVTGEPELGISDTCFALDTIQENQSTNTTLTITNEGCSTLVVTNISGVLPEYSASPTSFSLTPGAEQDITITFSPTSAGDFLDTLTIANNAGDSTICLSGTATAIPIISTNPDSFNVVIANCDDSTTQNLEIYNTGTGDLYVTLEPQESSIGSVYRYAYVADHDETVRVIDLVNNTVVQNVTGMNSNPSRVGIRPDGKFWYVSHRNSSNWRVYRSSDNSFVTSIGLANQVSGAAFTKDSKYAYIGARATDAVYKVDLQTNTVVATLTGSFSDPQDIKINPAETHVYVANRVGPIAIIDMSTDQVISTVGANGNHTIAITPNGSYAYLTNTSTNTVDVLNLSTNLITTNITGFNRPQQIDITPDGAFAYIANKNSNNVIVVSTATNTIVSTISQSPQLAGPWGVAISPNGEYVYVSSRDGTEDMVVIEVASNTIVDYIDLGNTPRGVATLKDQFVTWANVSPTIDTVPSGDTATIAVEFNGLGLYSGTYNAELEISSNDPLNPLLTIPLVMTIQGGASIALSDSCLDLDSIMANLTHQDTVTITNDGCDTLIITDINNTLAEYTISDTAGTLFPGESAEIVVTFSPTSAGTYNDTLTIVSNLSDSTICLTGDAFDPPVIAVDPDSFTVNFVVCDDSTDLNLDIINTGASDLIVNLGTVPASLGSSYPYYYRVSRNSNVVHVYDVSDNSLVSTQATLSQPWRVGIRPDGKFYYVGHRNNTNLRVFDASDNSFVTDISMAGTGHNGITFTKDSRFAYVTVRAGNNVKKVDLSTNTVVSTITSMSLSNPMGIAITPDELYGYVADRSNNSVKVFDLATESLVATIPAGSGAHDLVMTPNGAFVYVPNRFDGTVSKISTASNTVVATISGGFSNPHGVDVTPDGTEVWLANRSSSRIHVINVNTNAVTQLNDSRFDLGMYIAISADGQYALLSRRTNDPNLVVVDVSSRTIVDEFSDGDWGQGISTLKDWQADFVFPQTIVDTVLAGDTNTLIVRFNALDFLSGTYTSTLEVSSNDPLTPLVSIPCTMTVSGSPAVSLSDTCLDLDSIMINATSQQSLTITNSGCDTMFITDINNSLSEFSLSDTSFTILPNDEATLTVTFSPSSSGTFNDTLDILNNGTDTVVCLVGDAFDQPIISTIPDSFYVSITTCNDSSTQNLDILNTGLGDLQLTIETNEAVTGQWPYAYRPQWNSNTLSVIDLSDGSQVANVATLSQPWRVEVRPDGKFFYVQHRNSSSLRVFNAADNSFVTDLNMTTAHGGMAITRDSKWGYVTGRNNNTIRKINLTTHTTAGSFGGTLSNPQDIVLTSDGNTAYVCNRNNSLVNVFDLTTDTEITTINIGNSRGHHIAMTPDGQFVYVTRSSGNALVKISTATNTVVATIIGFNNPHGLDITPDGTEVWVANRSGSMVNVVSVSSNSITNTISSGNLNTGWGIAISPDGNRAWLSRTNNNPNLVEINANSKSIVNTYTYDSRGMGITTLKEVLVDFLTVTPNADTVIAGDTNSVAVKFNALGLLNGTYTGSITINSNDPVNPTISIPAILNVNAANTLGLSTTCLDVDTIIQNTSTQTTFTIYNNGCDSLDVTNITNNLGEYTLDMTSFSINAADSAVVTVTFSPTSTGTYNDTFSLSTSFGDTSICITGEAGASATIVLSTASIDAVIAACDDSTTETLTIFDTGLEDLSWELTGAESYDSTLFQIYSTAGEATNHTFNRVGNADSIFLEITLNGDFGASNETADLYMDGQLIGSILDGDIGDNIDVVVNYAFGGSQVDDWLNNDEIIVTIDNNGNVNGTNGDRLHQVQLSHNGLPWMIGRSVSSGTVNGGDSTTYDVEFFSSSLPAGDYIDTLRIYSNDPALPFLFVPCTLTVQGSPSISVQTACLEIDSTMEFQSDNGIITISNNGCDTLFVTNMTNALSEYTLSTTSLTILPFSTGNVTVTFSPTISGTYNDTLLIFNDDVDTSVCITAVAFDAPTIAIDPDSLSVNIVGCDGSTTDSVTVFNTGFGVLNFNTIDGVGQTFQELSSINFTFTDEQTTHTFSGIIPSDSIFLNITLNGDFDGAGEFADLYVDGTPKGTIVDGNPPNGTDIEVSYVFTGAEVATWLADGEIIVIVDNNNQVNLAGDNLHAVELIARGSQWISTAPAAGAIGAADSTTVIFSFDATGLNEGTYNSTVVVSSDDPVSGDQVVYVSMDVNGDPAIALSDTCYDFGTIDAFTSAQTLITINNTACDTLSISNITKLLPEYSVVPSSGDILPYSSADITITFSPTTAATFEDTLTISSNLSDTTICLTGTAVSGPIVALDTNSISVTINDCDDSTQATVTIYNTGTGGMTTSVETDSTAILVLGAYTDMGTPLNNMLLGLDTYYPSYTTTNTFTNAPSSLQSDLIGKDVLLIPPVNSGGSTANNVYISFASVIEEFIYNGGTVIWVGTQNTYAPTLFSLGIFEGNYSTAFGGVINTATYAYPVMNNLPPSWTETGTSYRYDISSDPDAVTLAHNLGEAFAAVKEIGRGRAIFIGSYYNTTDNDYLRLIANSVEWGGETESWLSGSPTSDTIAAGDSMVVTFDFYSAGLASGTYIENFVALTNDVVTPSISFACTLTVLGNPAIAFSEYCVTVDSTIELASSQDTFTIYNTGCDTLSISSSSNLLTEFAYNPTSGDILPYDSAQIVVSFSPSAAGVFTDSLTLFNNAGDTIICVTGVGTDKPTISVDPTSLDVTIVACDDSTDITLTVHNTGAGDLTWNAIPGVSNLGPIFGYALSTSANDDILRLISLASNTIVNSVSVGADPWRVEIAPNGLFAYTSNRNSSNVSVVDLSNFSLVTNISVGSRPTGMVITNNSKTGYVGNRNSNTVSVINLDNNTVSNTITGIDGPMDMILSDDELTLYVLTDNNDGIVMVSTTTNTITGSISIGFGTGGHHMVKSPDGTKAFVTESWDAEFNVIDLTTNTVQTTSTGYSQPHGCDITPDGAYVYFVDMWNSDLVVWDVAGDSVLTSINNVAFNRGWGVAVSPDGSTVYVSHSTNNTVTTVDVATNSVIGTIVGGNKTQGVTTLKNVIGNWLSLTPTSGNATAGDSSAITVTFNALGINSGTYYSDIEITSNDPANLSLIVPCTLTVVGAPVLALADTCHDLGGVLVQASNTDTFTIFNNGCDTLFFSSLTNTLSEFTLDVSSLTVLPYDSANIEITFSPTALGLHTDSIVMLNNDQDTFICITGTGLPAPTISAVPDSFNVTIIGCDDSTTATMRLFNTGAADLNWSGETGISYSGPILNYVYACNMGSNNVTVYDLSNDSLVATISVGSNPIRISIRPDGLFAYVTYRYGSTISVIDLTTNTVTATITGGDGQTEMGFSLNGQYGYIGNRWNNTVWVIDLNTNTVIDTWANGIDEPQFVKVTPDGQFAYVGNSDDNMVVYNLSTGSLIATIFTGGNGAHSMVFSPDGSKAYVAESWNGDVRVINTATHTITNTITGMNQPHQIVIDPFGEFLYVPDQSNNLVYKISTATESIVSSIGFSNAWGMAMSPYGDVAYVGSSNGSLGIIDLTSFSIVDNPPTNAGTRGLASLMNVLPTWLSASPDNSTIAAGDSTDVTLSFSGVGLNTGTYAVNYIISSNDPLNNPLIIPAVMNIVGAPEIALSETCLDLDSIMEYASHTDTFQISNNGCDTLFVTGISNSLTEFTVDQSVFSVPAGWSTEVIVTFTPTSVGSFFDTLIISNNDGDTLICLEGDGFGRPIISTDPDSFDVALNCDDTVFQSLTVFNTGLSPLDFYVNSQGIDGDNTYYEGFESGNLNKWADEGGGYAYSAQMGNSAVGDYHLDMTGGNTTYYDGISDTFVAITPEYISFWVYAPSGTNNNDGADLGIGDSNITNDDGIADFWIDLDNPTVRLWSPSEGTWSAGFNFDEWTKVELRDINWNAKIFDFYVDSVLIRSNFDFWNTGLSYLSVIHVFGWDPNNNFGFDEFYMGPSPDWITAVTPYTQTVAPGDSSQVSIEFNSTGLAQGTYNVDLLLINTDPLDPEYRVNATLNVTGTATLELSDTCLDLDSIQELTTHMDTFLITNTGCDTLTISNITNSLSEYTLNQTSFVLPPNTATNFIVTFAPTSIGTFDDTLHILNDLTTDTLICLTGEAFARPIISLNPDSIGVNLTGCDDTTSSQITVYNTGAADLIFSSWGDNSSNQTMNSSINYAIPDATTNHIFGGLVSADSMQVTVTLNGDFNATNESASLIIDGDNQGVIPDGNLPNGTNIVYQVTFSGAQVSSWLSDGSLTVTIDNSVDVGLGGSNLHQVDVDIFGDTWFDVTPSADTLIGGDSSILTVQIISTGLSSSPFTGEFYVESNDPIDPLLIVPVTLIIDSFPAAPSTQDTAICFGAPTPPLTAVGTLINWYSDPGLTTNVFTGLSYTPADTAIGVYTYYATDSKFSCESSGTATTLTISSSSTAATSAIATPASICAGDTATLSFTGGALAVGAVWNWYSASCGGTLVGTGTTIQVNPVTNTDYFVRAEGSCDTTTCVSVTLTMTTASTPAAAANASSTNICGGDSVLLTITGGSLGAGATWEWYSATCGGVAAGSGDSLWVTPALTTDFFVRAESACDTTVCATVNVAVGNSTAATGATASALVVCSGDSTTLIVQGGALGNGATWEWYSTSCGGTPVGSGDSLTVAVLANTTYFVRAESACDTTICRSVSITFGSLSTAPTSANASLTTICTGDSTMLTIVGGTLGTGAVWQWYSGSCGGTSVGFGDSLWVFPAGNTDYFVRAEGCDSTVCATVSVTANISSIAASGSFASPSTICNGDTSTLSVAGGLLGTGATWEWYTLSCGGTPVGSGTSIQVFPTVTTNYFVRAEGTCNTTTCEMITVTIGSASTPPTGANASAASICVGDSSTLSVVGGSLGLGGFWAWYSTSCGGTLVDTGASIDVFPVVNTDYFVRAEGCSPTTCASVSITVNTASTVPTATATPAAVCVGDSSTLSVLSGTLGTGGSWQWYTASCGGTPVASGATIMVAPAVTTTYYVRAEGTCNTTLCDTITVNISSNSTPATAANATPAAVCPGGSTTLSVTGGSLGVGANWAWYEGSCGGTLVDTGASITATPSGDSTFYFVRAEGSCDTTTCVSVLVTYTASVAGPTTDSAEICFGEPTPALHSIGAGTRLWYVDSPLTQRIFVGDSFTPTGTAVGTYRYWVTQLVGGCESEASVAQLVIKSIPAIRLNTYSTWVVAGNSVTLIAFNADTYVWTPGSGLNTTIGDTVIASPVAKTTYTVTGTTAGCSADTSVFVDVFETGIDDLLLMQDLNIYPNPTLDNVMVDFDGLVYEEVNIKLLDILGEVRYSRDYTTDKTGKLKQPIGLSDMDAGMYWLQITTERGTLNQKVVLQK